MWQNSFDRFLLVSGYIEKSEEVKVETLIYTMGPKANDILNSFDLSEPGSKNYNLVLQKFKEYFEPKKNVILKKALFN